ncbi:MAG: Major facilitator superfamily transporter [Candidatus Moranbacteria bacterium GW2011_GWE1_49_15]|nr:MAG: Major facilitator superfamily transporter [Candidatus Moranbacteria bacterium GW2011_GWE2_47_10]KKW05272.1 MAG: Major facilitator superfamily transporter [Candidatus Moranbacteria bacterium GW2011_GWE1_49_15]HBP01179.1 hypothetical protein [Candidatus Moranbacteria bacterium]
MNFSKEKWIIILTILVDVIGIGIVIPVLPFYAESFGLSPFQMSSLFAVFALFSFFSAPFLGALSDKIGRRPVLILSIASTAIGWFIFASAKNPLFLFVGRIVDGIAAGNFPIAQSYISDISKDDKERTSNLGVTGATFGIGFIIGPAIGAALSTVSPALPFWVVGVLATVNAIAAYFFLPETNGKLDRERKLEFNPLLPLIRAVREPLFKARYVAWFFFGLAVAGMQATFAIYMHDRFGFSSSLIGYVFTGMGVIMIFNQGFALKRFWLKNFKESSLELWPFLFFSIGFFLMSAESLALFFLGLLVMAFNQSILRVIVTSRVAGFAGPTRKGEALGAMSSIMSAAMIVGPMIGGALFEINASFPFLFSAFSIMAAFLVMKKFRKDIPEKKTEESSEDAAVTV